MAPFDAFAAAVRAHGPRVAVVLGSGLGAVPHRFAELASIPFADVPGLVAPSIHGHSGAIGLGGCAGVPLLVFRGRLHSYEGHPWDRVAAPIRLMASWGVRALILTNAAGGIHDRLGPGDLMVLRDHLWLQTPQAVVGRIGKPSDGDSPYSPRLIELLQRAEPGRELLAGVYAAVTGPCYETPAEIRALRAMGADAVGMSTAFEARTAAGLGMEVAAISCITNKAAGLTCGTLDHKEVLANAGRPAERISGLLETILPLLG
jgi:purine-nucleoside phosphorylase